MVNIKKIQDRMSELNISKAKLIKDSGLTRVTIDKILAGGKINVDTLEALAQGLSVNVGFFFDENIEDVKQTQGDNGVWQNAGRDANNAVNQSEHDELIRLREEVKFLKQIITDKDARIAELHKMNDFLMKGK